MRSTTVGSRLLALTITVMAVGCSSDEQGRDFTVPKALCGVSVPTTALSDLLPPVGKNISVSEGTATDDSGAGCEVKVDGSEVLSVERQRVEATRSAWNIASYDHGIGQVKSAANDSIAYVDRAAVSVVKCGESSNKDEAISTYIRTLKPGRQDESAMQSLISGYTTTFKKQNPC
ncbi:hypothetical protein [Streptomyces sp. NPDC058855]|uniref:hypothetical protein n=1 Tax=Streptomyces sp. NPDC058855 TaxID=3346651 RepID=UPI0036B3E5EE